MHALERDPEKTAIVAATALRLSEEQGYPFFVGAALVYRGWALAQGGQATDGIEFCRSGIIQLRALGAINWLPRYLALLTECHEKAGDAVSALRELGEAFRAMEETGEGSWEAELHRLKGRLLLRTGVAPEQAESCFARAMAVAGGQEARLLELRAATSLAGLFSERGRRAEARDVLAPIYAWFTEDATMLRALLMPGPLLPPLCHRGS